jgi:hypothetical protein
VTVCVAVICANSMVMGMSDRMLTAGDVQFQPSTSKIWNLTTSIVMMSSGDVGTQSDIYTDVHKRVTAELRRNPSVWLRVETVAEYYRLSYFSLQRRRAEAQILGPLGLDSESFLIRQTSMEPDFVAKIGAELISFRMPDTGAIIASVNPVITVNEEPRAISPDIFVIQNGRVSCSDRVGFACVGAGAWHANSTLMLAGHTPSTRASKALFTMYAAKRRAEVAPGVGSETDTFVVTGLGGYSELRDEMMGAAAKAYAVNAKESARALAKAEKYLDEYIEQITNLPQSPESQADHGAEPAAPADAGAG